MDNYRNSYKTEQKLSYSRPKGYQSPFINACNILQYYNTWCTTKVTSERSRDNVWKGYNKENIINHEARDKKLVTNWQNWHIVWVSDWKEIYVSNRFSVICYWKRLKRKRATCNEWILNSNNCRRTESDWHCAGGEEKERLKIGLRQ